MFKTISDNWHRWLGMALLALGFSVFQYYFIPISIDKDTRGHYVNPTSILHGRDKINRVAQEFCDQNGQQISNFRITTKSIGGESHKVYRFNCKGADKKRLNDGRVKSDRQLRNGNQF